MNQHMPRVNVRRKSAKRTVVLQVRVPIELRNEVARHANADTISISTAARQLIAEGAERRRAAKLATARPDEHVKAAA
jgi:hypothetical protein